MTNRDRVIQYLEASFEFLQRGNFYLDPPRSGVKAVDDRIDRHLLALDIVGSHLAHAMDLVREADMDVEWEKPEEGSSA